MSTQNYSCPNFPTTFGSGSLLGNSKPIHLGQQSRLTSSWKIKKKSKILCSKCKNSNKIPTAQTYKFQIICCCCVHNIIMYTGWWTITLQILPKMTPGFETITLATVYVFFLLLLINMDDFLLLQKKNSHHDIIILRTNLVHERPQLSQLMGIVATILQHVLLKLF